jgi:drug/metabolite transporter (DMT)-like permease
MFLVFAANALLAGTYTIGKFLLSYMQPIYLNALRMMAAGTLLLFYQFFFNRIELYIQDKKAIVYLVKVAFLNIFLSYALAFWALQHIGTVRVTFLYNTSPLFTPFFSYFFFSERMTIKKCIGLLIGFIGFTFSIITREKLQGFTYGISNYELAVIFAVAAYCFGWVYLRRLIKGYHYAPVTVNGYIFVIGGLMSFLAALIFETWEPITNTTSFWCYFSLFVIMGNLIANTLYTTLFKYYTVTFISFAGLTTPLFAAIYGYFFLGEVITMQLLISMVIVACGLYIFYQEELRQGYIIKH